MAPRSLQRQRILYLASTVAALSLLWQPHVFLNDDLVQGLGLDALSHGRLHIQRPFPSDFEFLLTQGWRHAGIPDGNETVIPLGSTPLNLLALPMYGLLAAVAAVVGASATLTLLVATVAATACQMLLRDLAPPQWASRSWKVAVLVFLVIGVSAFTPIQRNSPADRFALELAAIQHMSMLLAALGGLCIHDLLRERFPTQAWTLTLAYTFATPVAFWAGQAKYHSFSIALVAALVWALVRLVGRRRFVVGGLLAGVACWNQVPMGIISVLALGVTSVLSAAPFMQRLLHGVQAAVAVVPGLAALAVEWLLLRRLGFGSQYFPPANTTSEWTSAAQATWSQDLHSVWLLFVDAIVWSDGGVIGILSIACLAPFLVLGMASMGRRFWPGTPRDLVIFCLAYSLLLFLVMRGRLADVGYAYENRHVVTLLPPMVLLGAPGLAVAAAAAGRRAWGWIGFGAAYVLGMNLFLNYTAHQLVYTFTQNRHFDEVFLWRVLGAFAALATAAWVLWGWIGKARKGWSETGGALWISGVVLALSFQVWILLGREGFYNPPDEPFRFWLIEEIHQAFKRIAFHISSRVV